MTWFNRSGRFSTAVSPLVLSALLTACGGGGGTLPASHGGGPPSTGPAGTVRHVRTIAGASYQDVCAAPGHGRAACAAMIPLDRIARHQPDAAASTARRASSVRPGDTFPFFGWWPPDVQSAYALPTGPRAGAGATVAIVDAFDSATVEDDLAVYRAFFNLPPCTTRNGCFRKVNAHGRQGNYPANGQPFGWTLEIALDVDAVSAACPNCKIVLVEADSDFLTDLAVAAETAGKLGDVVSNSYFAPEVDPNPDPGELPTTALAKSYRHEDVVYTAASGDFGFESEGLFGVQSDGNSPFPAGVPDVVAVGGTILTNPAYPSPTGWQETAASFSGGGCSTVYPKPAWQLLLACPHRLTADVAATADGLSVYDSVDLGGWGDIGGTSASTPIIAGVYALARGEGTLGAASLYLHPGALHDITTGSSGSCAVSYFCNARAGYDGPTGMGSPNGTRAFRGAPGDD